MVADENPQNGLRRLAWGMGISVLFNLGVWGLAARAVQHTRARPPETIEITRVILPVSPPPAVPKTHHTMTMPPQPPRMVSLRPRPLPASHPVLRLRAIPAPLPETKPRSSSAPQLAHNRVLISHGPTPAPNTARLGGGATPGALASSQKSTERTKSVLPTPLPPDSPTPKSDPPRHDAPSPVPTPPPIHMTIPQTSVPNPSGPTTEAQVERLVLPEIPDDLQQEDYKSSVHVTVDIDAQGAATRVTLNSSSGNAEVDRRAINALMRSRYRPALQNGLPIAGTKRFRFDFEVP